jgi:hypothetical protein
MKPVQLNHQQKRMPKKSMRKSLKKRGKENSRSVVLIGSNTERVILQIPEY